MGRPATSASAAFEHDFVVIYNTGTVSHWGFALVSHWFRTGFALEKLREKMWNEQSSTKLLGKHAAHTNTRGVARGGARDVARTNHEHMSRCMLTSFM